MFTRLAVAFTHTSDCRFSGVSVQSMADNEVSYIDPRPTAPIESLCPLSLSRWCSVATPFLMLFQFNAISDSVPVQCYFLMVFSCNAISGGVPAQRHFRIAVSRPWGLRLYWSVPIGHAQNSAALVGKGNGVIGEVLACGAHHNNER
jgi:hypothetical protein